MSNEGLYQIIICFEDGTWMKNTIDLKVTNGSIKSIMDRMAVELNAYIFPVALAGAPKKEN